MRKTYFIWFALVAFLILGCRNENFHTEEQTTLNNSQFRKLTAKDIPKIMGFLKKEIKTKNLEVQIHPTLFQKKGDTALENATVLTDLIIEANYPDKSYYIFPVKTQNPENKNTYNLEVVTVNGHITDTYIQAYYPTEEWLQNTKDDFGKFSGTIKSYDVDGSEISSMDYVLGARQKDCPKDSTGNPPGNPTNPNTGSGGGTGMDNGETGGNPGGGGLGGGGLGGGSTGGGGGSDDGDGESGCGPSVLSNTYIENGYLIAIYTNGCNETIKVNVTLSQNRLSGDCPSGSGVVISTTSDPYDMAFRQFMITTLSTEVRLAVFQDTEMYNKLKAYFFQNLSSSIAHKKIAIIASEKYKNQSLDWQNFQNWIDWSYNYLGNNYEAEVYFNAHPGDLQYIFFDDIDPANVENVESVNVVADVISDILINEKKGTLSNLSFNWPGLGSLKEKVKGWISKGVYTTASYTRNYLVIPLSKYADNNPNKVNWINTNVIDKIRTEAVTPLVNFNENTMSWGDLFNIWLFELTPGKYANNTINFTNTSNVVNGNNIYNPSTNAVKNFPKGNNTPGGSLLNIQSELANGLGIGETKSGYFKYDVNAFYSTLSNANIGIQMLGSFPVTAKVLSKSGNTALVEFHIYNNLGWDSATRFIKGSNGNEGLLHDKAVGTGFHMGGTIRNNFTWTETVNF